MRKVLRKEALSLTVMKNLSMYLTILRVAHNCSGGITIPELRHELPILRNEKHDRIWYGFIRPLWERGLLERHDYQIRRRNDKGQAGTVYTITLSGRLWVLTACKLGWMY